MYNKNGVCLVGLAPTKYTSQYKKWTVNEGYYIYKDSQLTFQLHKYNHLKELNNRYTGQNYIEELKKCEIPIFMHDDYKDIPMSMKFPINELMRYFKTKLFNSSIDYMLAYAIYKGYKDIDIIGVDMKTIAEYSKQKPSLLYWYGISKMLNVNVNIKSDYFWNEDDKKIYGYEV